MAAFARQRHSPKPLSQSRLFTTTITNQIKSLYKRRYSVASTLMLIDQLQDYQQKSRIIPALLFDPVYELINVCQKSAANFADAVE
ncbi:hypothetical protein PR048_015809 [Dryococelus australis]|uniref:Uncharacterized protein n=1 Tax=Dryococelus australis TaxID=614101 RepID=A0ABQ9HI09_9NEOP|nr:hypothetical protein PR048_015809 [Dryococelus australis]